MPSSPSNLFLLLAMALLANGQAPAMPGCGNTCIDLVISQHGAELGCPTGGYTCLCTNPSFANGVKDCSKGNCAPDLLPVVDTFITNLCATATAPAAPATTTPAPTTPPVSPSTTVTPAAVPTTPSTTTSSTVVPIAPGTSAAVSSPGSGPQLSTSSSPLLPSSSPTAGTKNPPASTTGSPAGAKEATSSDPPAGGLSSGAKIGVGIGAAAGGIALIAVVAFFLITRRHRNKAGQGSRYQISEPLPGSGRSYANDHHHQRYQTSAKSELESNSRRYEDMIPRQKPRTMV